MKTLRDYTKSSQSGSSSGFTIIEVVIVLALAAFIFTIVFFAVPQLQRALRDNQRNSDASRVVAELITYQSANEGQLPGDSTEGYEGFQARYFDPTKITLEDPSGAEYEISGPKTTGDEPARSASKADVFVYPGFRCNGENIEPTDSPRDFAVMIARDSETTFICRDNS